MNSDDLIALPYDERRIVVVTDKVPMAPAKTRRWRTLEAASSLVPGGLVISAGLGLFQIVADFREDGEDVLPIELSTAQGLRFPPGHPRRNVVYVGHPVDAGSYIPAADFHRFLFEHKVAEALRLVRSLGAETVKVVYIEGWDSSAAAKLGLSLPQAVAGADVEVGLDAGRQGASTYEVLTKMRLAPSGEPAIPADLVWTPHEPLWSELAHARIESGLTEIVIDIRSTDDFGVNAGLKVLIQKTGLDAGGEFVEHKKTTWRLEATFSS